MKRRSLIIIAVILAGAAAMWQFFWTAAEVKVTRPQKRDVVEMVIASGRLRAVRQSDLGAEVAGTVEKVLVVEGDRVTAGQPLFVLRQTDSMRQLEQSQLALATAQRELERARRGPLPEEIRRERAELDRSRSARELAEKDYERASQLHRSGVLSLAELQRALSSMDQAKAAQQSADENLQALLKQPRIEDLQVAQAKVREAEAAIKLGEERLRQRTVAAPANGLIIKRQLEPGQSVVPGNALLTIAYMDRTEIYVETDENNLRKLRTGQNALVAAPAYQDRPFCAVLTQIGPDVDHKRGVVGLRLQPEALPDFVRPDMTMDVNIEVARFSNVWSLPLSSILEQEGLAHVLVVENGNAVSKKVTLLGKSGDWAALEGLAESSRVVIRATEIKAGQKVREREVL
jgi:HlyD family secretion protein